MIAVLVIGMPCTHALMHDDHHAHPETAPCEWACAPCSCHSCDHEPCTASVEFQLERTVQPALSGPEPVAVLRPAPAHKPVSENRRDRLPHPGVLDALQTVHLLI
jgi:hypothetical protein